MADASTGRHLSNAQAASLKDENSHHVSSQCTLHDWYTETLVQLHTVIPSLIGFILAKLPWMISLRFLGALDDTHALAAASFGNSIVNIAGVAVSIALSSALATLTSQAVGEMRHRESTPKEIEMISSNNTSSSSKKETERVQLLQDDENEQVDAAVNLTQDTEEVLPSVVNEPQDQEPIITPLVYLYRGLFINFLFIGPVVLWWLFGMRSTLRWLGQDETLSELTTQYLQILAPGMLFLSVQWTLTVWLQSIGLAYIIPAVGAIGLFVHIPINHIFMFTWGGGFVGNAWATVVNQVLQTIMMLGYILFTNGHDRVMEQIGASPVGRTGSSWHEVHVAWSTGKIQYLKLAVPAIISISEWWASEVCTVLAGRLPQPDLSLGSMAIFQSLNDMAFMFPLSWATAGTMRIGYWLGANNPVRAQHSSRVSLAFALLLTLTLSSILLFVLPASTLPYLFAPKSHDLVAMTSDLMPILAVYVLGDCFACSFNGVMKGCGRQAVVSPIVIVAYWCIGLPVAFYQAFSLDNGVVGLVTGTTTGTWIHGTMLGIAVLCFTNWRYEAEQAQERVRQSS